MNGFLPRHKVREVFCPERTMYTDQDYMRRCLQLARNGLGYVRPNPMVGCVVVSDGEVVAEGFHRQHGGYHAERNAILDCSCSERIEGSTLYVNLEPCSHQGLTPPCADLIVERKVRRVVVCNDDPNPQVSGRGYEKLRSAGIEVVTHVLEQEGRFLNRRFFTFMEQRRPYIILKWAETADGLMDIDRGSDPQGSYWITNPLLKQLSHRWRTEEAAILVGSETYLNDRPQLTARLWHGNQPLRLVYDRRGRLGEVDGFTVLQQPTLSEAMEWLYQQKVQSLIVEGGRHLLDAFLAEGLWDEIRRLRGDQCLGKGMPAPSLTMTPDRTETFDNNQVECYYHVR